MKCMDSWHRCLKDYQFILWNFDRFDKNSSIWVQQAFDSKKYAFAADYIRLYALYNYGGIYLDMDVEVIKSFDVFLSLQTMICFENDGKGKLEMAAFGAEPGLQWIKDCLKYYEQPFINEDGSFKTKVIPEIAQEILLNNYSVKEVSNLAEAQKVSRYGIIPIFNSEYFSPKSYISNDINITSNTICIHHFASSWISPLKRMKLKIWNYISVHLSLLASIIRYCFGNKG